MGLSQNLFGIGEEWYVFNRFSSSGWFFNSLEMGENLRRIGLEVDEAEAAKFLNKVEVGSEEERQKYISSLKADGTPRSGASGAVIDLQNERAELDDKPFVKQRMWSLNCQ